MFDLACVQLENDSFDTLFHSPLKRAATTANIIWGDREGDVVVMPSLREIDLYSFQVPPLTCMVSSCHPPPSTDYPANIPLLFSQRADQP